MQILKYIKSFVKFQNLSIHQFHVLMKIHISVPIFAIRV